MNLHGIAGPIIGAVNPSIPVSLQISTGPGAPQADGTQTPGFAPAVIVTAQVQPMTWRDLQMLDGVNLEGVRWKIYLYGEVNGVVRPERKGGDLVTISTGRHRGVWLVTQVLEQWPDWVCAAIVQQNGQ